MSTGEPVREAAVGLSEELRTARGGFQSESNFSRHPLLSSLGTRGGWLITSGKKGQAAHQGQGPKSILSGLLLSTCLFLVGLLLWRELGLRMTSWHQAKAGQWVQGT